MLTSQDLLATVQKLQDERDIYQVLVTYCFLHDQGRPDRLVGDVFTEDAVLDFGTGRLQGGDQINTFYGAYEGVMLGTQHHLSNVYIEIDGDRAKSTSYVQAWHWFRQDQNPIDIRPADIMATGGYQDEWTRTDKGWRISKRVTAQFGTGLGTGFAGPELMPLLRGMMGRLPDWPIPSANASNKGAK